MIKFLSCIEGFYAPKSYTIGRSFLNGYLDGQCVEVRCKESRSNLPANLREKGLLSRQEWYNNAGIPLEHLPGST